MWKKPKYLRANKKATRKDQAKFEVYEKRLENFPLTEARTYLKEINELGFSIRDNVIKTFKRANLSA